MSLASVPLSDRLRARLPLQKPAAFLSEEYLRGVGSEPFHQGPLPRPERFTTRTMVVGSLNQSGAIAVLIARISTGFIKAKSLFCHSQQYITRSGVACQL